MNAFMTLASRLGLTALLGLAAATSDATTTTEYIHTDALGSVVAITDANRVVIERREYEPFGQQLTPVVQNGPGYTGHVQDAATGLTYMQQRYYDPGVGRFLSVDPVAADDQTGANFNPYSYANNNAYRYTDPDGRVVVAARKDDEAKLVRAINAQSKTQYEFNAAGELQALPPSHDNASGSATYSKAINQAISSKKQINLGYAKKYQDSSGSVKSVDKHNGGGVTMRSSKGILVRVSGNKSGLDIDVNDNDLIDSPESVLRHEFVGHVAPMLSYERRDTNSRELDNVSRAELGLPLLRSTNRQGKEDPVEH